MNEDIKNPVDEENTSSDTSAKDLSNDQLKEAISEQLRKNRRINMLIGAQAASRVVLDKIISFENQSGRRTMNDYKRLVKDVRKFCETGLSRKVNADGETEPIDKTVQN